MSDRNRIYVYFDHKTEVPERLGVISIQSTRGKEIFSFEFDKGWLQKHQDRILDPEKLKGWYGERLAQYNLEGRRAYDRIRDSFNASPNGADLLFLCRSCYGGVVRFRQVDGAMSTPCGAHTPISLDSFSERVNIWYDNIFATSSPVLATGIPLRSLPKMAPGMTI